MRRIPLANRVVLGLSVNLKTLEWQLMSGGVLVALAFAGFSGVEEFLVASHTFASSRSSECANGHPQIVGNELVERC
jgi:hypothetical protein